MPRIASVCARPLRAIVFGATLLGVVAWAPRLRAHTLLVTPPPRDQRDGYKDPAGPCGVSRTVPPQPLTQYRAGAALHVEWSETIDHPGCFVIDFAQAGDTNFQILGVKSHQGAAGATPRAWSLDVTLPSAPCTGCTLRSRQLMLGSDLPDAQCPPPSVPSGGTYYSCANITLTGADQADDGGQGPDATSDAAPPAAPDAAAPAAPGLAEPSPANSDSGCQYATGPTSGFGPLALLLAGGLLGRRARQGRRLPRHLRPRQREHEERPLPADET